jgi:hypothetical protein
MDHKDQEMNISNGQSSIMVLLIFMALLCIGNGWLGDVFHSNSRCLASHATSEDSERSGILLGSCQGCLRDGILLKAKSLAEHIHLQEVQVTELSSQLLV